MAQRKREKEGDYLEAVSISNPAYVEPVPIKNPAFIGFSETDTDLLDENRYVADMDSNGNMLYAEADNAYITQLPSSLKHSQVSSEKSTRETSGRSGIFLTCLVILTLVLSVVGVGLALRPIECNESCQPDTDLMKRVATLEAQIGGLLAAPQQVIFSTNTDTGVLTQKKEMITLLVYNRDFSDNSNVQNFN